MPAPPNPIYYNAYDIVTLNDAIEAANAVNTPNATVYITLLGHVTINLSNTPLKAINLRPGVTLTIDGYAGSGPGNGPGATLDGGGNERGLFVYAGTVNIDDLAINNMQSLAWISTERNSPYIMSLESTIFRAFRSEITVT